MKKLLKITTLVLLTLTGYAQEDALTSQYFFNPLYVNPAYAGSKEVMSAALLYRAQWVGIKDAPKSQTFSIHAPINGKKASWGAQLYNHTKGPLQNTGIAGVYAYRVPMGNGKFSLGIQGTLNQISLDLTDFEGTIINDVTVSATNNVDTRVVPDANFGAYYYTDKFTVGAAVNNIIQNRINLTSGGAAVVDNSHRQFYATSSAAIPLKEGAVIFRPSVLLKVIEGAPLNMDYTASFLFNEKLWVGATYRTNKKTGTSGFDNSIIGIIEYIFDNNVRVGYSYDYGFNDLQQVSSGSHEILLSYDFNLTKGSVTSPRYF